MKIIRNEVRTFLTELMCEEQLDKGICIGTFETTGVVKTLPLDDAQVKVFYEYKCSNCSIIKNLENKFPIIEYVIKGESVHGNSE